MKTLQKRPIPWVSQMGPEVIPCVLIRERQKEMPDIAGSHYMKEERASNVATAKGYPGLLQSKTGKKTFSQSLQKSVASNHFDFVAFRT